MWCGKMASILMFMLCEVSDYLLWVHHATRASSERSLGRLVAANSPALRSTCSRLRTGGNVWNLQSALWFHRMFFLPSNPLLFFFVSFLRLLIPKQAFFGIPVAAFLANGPQRRIQKNIFAATTRVSCT